MKNTVLHIVICCCMVITTSCGISEDCFKGNGNEVTQTFPLDNFTKIKVYDGVGLVIKEGPIYEVKVKTSDNILDNLEVKIDRDMLVIKDNSTCNLARDYSQTVVYVTTPLLEEIHSKTEQEIKSDGVLTFPELRLYSVDISDGAGTGDFRLFLNTVNLYVESNNVSNFYLSGFSNNLHVYFWWGNGIFYGDSLNANTIDFYHRGSNDMIFYPINQIEGKIYSTGNVRLTNQPNTINVTEFFTGRLIIE